MNFVVRYTLFFVLMSMIACNDSTSPKEEVTAADSTITNSYASDRKFLQEHSGGLLELSSADGKSKVLLSAEYQGRVMTSSANGDDGRSFGWINYKLIQAPQKKAQFNPVGGEERFWLGPEGGQYSLYFKGGDSFNIDHWQVPALIDTLAYEVADSSRQKAVFTKKASLVNYSGTQFDFQVERSISLLGRADLESKIGTSMPEDVQFVGYRTDNKIQNTGTADWTPDKGLMSVWLLGMFTPSAKTTVIIPFTPVKDARSHITDNYFGSVPPERLQVSDSVLFFQCDGKFRSKIGLSPVVAKPMAASFDFQENVLTLVIPTISKDERYVNAKWELQKEPYKGDVINSYNDGPLENGEQMGPFYEIESSSPALELKKGEARTYSQVTAHVQGNYESLRALALKLLQVDLNTIKK
jgi:hypothetical protein